MKNNFRHSNVIILNAFIFRRYKFFKNNQALAAKSKEHSRSYSWLTCKLFYIQCCQIGNIENMIRHSGIGVKLTLLNAFLKSCPIIRRHVFVIVQSCRN